MNMTVKNWSDIAVLFPLPPTVLGQPSELGGGGTQPCRRSLDVHQYTAAFATLRDLLGRVPVATEKDLRAVALIHTNLVQTYDKIFQALHNIPFLECQIHDDLSTILHEVEMLIEDIELFAGPTYTSGLMALAASARDDLCDEGEDEVWADLLQAK